jgi:hypothetical protein
MTGLHEALDDIANEISPSDPPVERAMLRGHRTRIRRRTGAVAGTAGVMAVAIGAAVGIPSLTSHPGGPPVASGPTGAASQAAGTSRSIGDAPLARPVLLFTPQGSAKATGDASLVDRATLRLFHKVTCPWSTNVDAVNDQWKATAGYTAAQWNAPGSETVSCDSAGNKYVLGKAVISGANIISASAGRVSNFDLYVVRVRLDSKGTSAFTQLTTTQYEHYYLAYQQNNNINDEMLDSTAIVINGDVQSAPVTTQPITSGGLMISGPQPSGFTKAQATALAKYLQPSRTR